MRLFWIIFIGITFYSCSKQLRSNETQLFKNGTGAYDCYRIPAIIKTPKGTLMAFTEGRKTSCNDFGNVDILLRTSNDEGKNWTESIVVADFGNLQVSNPAPVVDHFDPKYPKGRIFLFYNTGNVSEHNLRLGKGIREVHFITSIDEGKSWSKSINITNQVHFNSSTSQSQNDWRTNATTPGHAIQFKRPPYQGRLYIPANHSKGDPLERFNEYRAYGFYTDDHGKHFEVSPDLKTPSSTEAIGTELSDGRLMLNVREQNGASKTRLIALSSTGGEQWDTEFFDNELISPVCQSSILLFEGSKDTILIYSGPNSKNLREKMTIKGSFDEGKTWPLKKEIYSGTAAYSDLVQINENDIGLLYERDNNGVYFNRLSYLKLTE